MVVVGDDGGGTRIRLRNLIKYIFQYNPSVGEGIPLFFIMNDKIGNCVHISILQCNNA